MYTMTHTRTPRQVIKYQMPQSAQDRKLKSQRNQTYRYATSRHKHMKPPCSHVTKSSKHSTRINYATFFITLVEHGN